MNRRWMFALAATAVIGLLIALAPAVSAAPPHDSSIIHIVRPGETLSGIARYYGVDMWVIARVNNILNPNRIYVGQRLIIPVGGAPGFIHIVQPGETLTRIAARYGVSVWAIAQANGIYNTNYIWAGQRLLIPQGGYVPPTQTPTTGTWYGQYYNNLTLTDPPCYTRYDAGVNFNWDLGAPAPGVPADGFSVRWTRTAYFSGGVYRFYARVDDGVRVWVDNTLIIDQWYDGAVRTFSADMTLGPGNHAIRVEFYDRTQVARIHFWWERIGAPTETPTPTTPPAGAGWLAQFYNNMDLQPPPVATRYDPWIGFEWKTGSPLPQVRNDFFSIRWTTTAYLEAGTYRFCAMIDDGARIFVDGVRVLDEWHPTNGLSFCGKHAVAAGNHNIEVQYYEEGGNALIYVWWEKD